MKSPDKDGNFSDRETVRRRDAALLRALKTPPKPHSEMIGKGKPKKKPTGKSKPDK